jgi:hypothetical protein
VSVLLNLLRRILGFVYDEARAEHRGWIGGAGDSDVHIVPLVSRRVLVAGA